MVDAADNGDDPPKRSKRKGGVKESKADAYLGVLKDRKLRGQLKHKERLYAASASRAAKVGQWLAPEDHGHLEAEGIEETWQLQQGAIVAAVEEGAARKAFDLELAAALGPYRCTWSLAGRHMLLSGGKGHLAVSEWQSSHLVSEVQVKETVRDATFLHNESFFAAAQKKYTYIYDKRGLEVHCLRLHTEPLALTFLPRHFLLASACGNGLLVYQDTSTGMVVAQHRTRAGPMTALRHNPYNAVVLAGHSGGVVTMWTPNLTSPVVKMLCHRGPITAFAVDGGGRYLVTAGVDRQVKVWDVRTYQPLHAYFANSPATCLDISQSGMLAVGQGRRVQVWRDALAAKAQAPYMTHVVPGGTLASLRFCPWEDVLGCGHEGGISTALLPGAGEPNFDSWVANPYASRKERREAEVASLMDKLQPETIVLDPESIGKVRKEPAEVQRQRVAEAEAANLARVATKRAVAEERTKMKGKNRPTRRHRRKQQNVIEDRLPAVKARMQTQEERAKAAAAQQRKEMLQKAPSALRKFYS